MIERRVPDRRRRAAPRRLVLLAGALLSLAGCLGTGKPLPVVTSYELDYAPPSHAERPSLDVAVRVELLGATQVLAGTDMVYQPGPYRRNSYNYARWVSPPPELVAALLVRDLQGSGLFRGVFSSRGGMAERFLVHGTVEQFLEVDQSDTGTARVALILALLDTRPPQGGRAVLFQRRYRAEGTAEKQTAEGLAASMSGAVQQVSRAVVEDIYLALSSYVKQGGAAAP